MTELNLTPELQEVDKIVLKPPVDKVDYVDNDEMLAAYIAFQAYRKQCFDEGKEEPPIPRYLAECIMKICRHLSFKYNFINYSFREEMMLDAIENCVKGFNKFDPSRSKYIFSYFTTAAWNMFVRRIIFEERQSETKAELISDMDVDSLVLQEHDNGDFQADFIDYMKEVSYFTPKNKKTKAKIEVPEELKSILIFDMEFEEDE